MKNKRDEYAQRLSALEELLRRDGVDAAVIAKREDVHYLSGYAGSNAALVFTVSRRPKRLLVTDPRYSEEAERSAPGWEPTMWINGMAAFIGRALRRLRTRTVGFSPSTTTVFDYQAMSDAAGPKTEFRDIDAKITSLRAVKSEYEIAQIEKAVECAHSALLAAKRRWKAGMTEREVKNDLEWEMRRRGAEDAAFETIVASGANASLPHAHAGDRRLETGKMLLIDFGARLGFYNSDATRTLWLGGMPRRWRKRYQAILAAQCAGLAKIGAGTPCSAPDIAARKELSAAGLEEYFTHGLGHGVGLEVHEEPRLGRRSRIMQEAGNVVTVEPGVYFPGEGGIRIEDMAVATPDGARMLGALPKDAEWAIM
ncbi:MAG: Xaa-Pro peptidase family protein [Planctomycetota bacterium]|jgi:Xaa-Pro aminopeptidase|nr:Xaa-Pro peptidase family protein [Planctomycetota bacterium]